MIGIYKITNLINLKTYIGQSNDIERRFKQHKSKYEQKRHLDLPLYKAFAKYGINNFKFEILEECQFNELDEREKYYIKLYKSLIHEHGYNIKIGGNSKNGENHPRHKLTEAEVEDIRLRYNNKERCKDVEKIYSNKIGHSGFSKIWKGETWKHIMPEVYTQENKNFHKHNTGQQGSNNGRAKLTEEDVYNIRVLKKMGEDIKLVYEKYKYTGITFRSFQNVWLGYNWKNIKVE